MKKSGKLPPLIKALDRSYGDGLIKAYWRNPCGDYGDTLAKFIVLECNDIVASECDLHSQAVEAHHRLASASQDLQNLLSVCAKLAS